MLYRIDRTEVTGIVRIAGGPPHSQAFVAPGYVTTSRTIADIPTTTISARSAAGGSRRP